MCDPIQLVTLFGSVTLGTIITTHNEHIEGISEPLQVISLHLDPFGGPFVGVVLRIQVLDDDTLLVPLHSLIELIDDIFKVVRLDGLHQLQMHGDGFDDTFEHLAPVIQLQVHHVTLLAQEALHVEQIKDLVA